MARIRKGDRVIVTTGKDKGQTGDVVRVVADRVFVAGLNLIKRHTKPNPQTMQAGGVIEREASFHSSNVTLVNPLTGKGEQVSCRIMEPQFPYVPIDSESIALEMAKLSDQIASISKIIDADYSAASVRDAQQSTEFALSLKPLRAHPNGGGHHGQD